jgi:hypothetical protein
MPDAMKPDIHGVRAPWIRGFIAFKLARRTRTVVLMVPTWPESDFRKLSPDCGRAGGAGRPGHALYPPLDSSAGEVRLQLPGLK